MMNVYMMLGTLINRLIMSGRSAEVGKAATDSNFRNKLYKEYDIKPEDFELVDYEPVTPELKFDLAI